MVRAEGETATAISPLGEVASRLTAAETVQRLRVRQDVGLTENEVIQRRAIAGANIIPTQARHPLLGLLFKRFQDVLVIILAVAAVVSAVLGETADAVIIAIALALDLLLSFLQVWRAEVTLSHLKAHLRPLATVRRGGIVRRVASEELVVGDLIELRPGQRVPADGRVITTVGLKTHEAILTGEPGEVSKQPAALPTKTPQAEQTNMVFMGTTVTSGAGLAVVTAVGTYTALGKVALVLKRERSPASPLRRQLTVAGARIGAVIIILVVLMSLVGLTAGVTPTAAVRVATTLVVSAIPEDLSIILTIALTVGVVRILRARGVVRELAAAETLGSATDILTDKTGTITAGRMEAVAFDCLQGTVITQQRPPRGYFADLALIGWALGTAARRARPDGREYVGSRTEQAGLCFAEALGFTQAALRRSWRTRSALPFTATSKYRATLVDHPTHGTQFLFVTGAPDVLLDASAQALNEAEAAEPLTAARRRELAALIEAHASHGQRLVGLAVRRYLSATQLTPREIRELLFLGVLIITDPIRPGVASAVAEAQAAGVRVRLVTGDLLATARAVARQVGLTTPIDSVLTGEEIAGLSDGALAARLPSTTICARVTPLDKQRIVRVMQSAGHVVAMTGDGVNDAVALKTADIGVAMGSGTDIAKEAADIVLIDDNFATIVAAIRAGRTIRDNLRKVIAFLLATNAAEVALFIVSALAGLPLPLLPGQILWINLVTDGTSDTALALEPAERNLMRRPPIDPRTPLIDGQLIAHIAYTSIAMTVACTAVYGWLLYQGAALPYARTMVFTLLATVALVATWSFSSLRETFWRRGGRNGWLYASAGFSFALQLMAIYVAPLRGLFHTVVLHGQDWLVILLLAVVTVVIVELRKPLFARWPFLTAEHARRSLALGTARPA